MKIRTGFVSNSSSTSFCIVGYYTPLSSSSDEDKIDDIQQDLEAAGVDVIHLPDSYETEPVYIGLNITDMNDDETLKQFKDRAEKLIRDILGEDTPEGKPGILTDGWYNG